MEKNILTNSLRSVFVCALMLFATQAFAAWDGSSMEEPGVQEIDGKDFYLIENESQLAWFANETNKGGKLDINAKLVADLDMNHKLWTPLAAGKGDVAFAGIIDGDNHVISNLYINSDEIAAVKKEFAQNLGFVGVLGNGSVKNIVFENVDIVTSTNAGSIVTNKTSQISVGAVVGWLADKTPGGVVSTCYVSGNITATGNGQGVGGIVGNAKNGTIENCMSAVSISATGNDAFIGGIVGISKASLTVKTCVYDGEGLSNTGNGSTGAIVGNHLSGTLTSAQNYYDDDALLGTGKGTAAADVHKMDEVNVAEVACKLNNGTLTDGVCDKDSPWSVGEKSLALNGYGAATISVLTVKVTQYGAVTITEYPDKTVAEIDGSYVGPDTVKIAKDIFVDQVVFNRTFNVNKMSSMMMPFSIDTANVSGAVIYEFKEMAIVDDVWKVKVRKAATVLANTPYMVLPKAQNITFDIEKPVTFNTTVKTDKVLSTGSWEFKGVYAYTTFENDPDLGRIYGFAATESDGVKVGQFVKVGSDAWAPAMRAYLVHHAAATAAAKTHGSLEHFGLGNPLEIDIEFVDDNNNVVETGKLNTVTGEVRMDRWFDLNGRKLNAKPTARGTYYHNGKREIIK